MVKDINILIYGKPNVRNSSVTGNPIAIVYGYVYSPEKKKLHSFFNNNTIDQS